MIKHRNTLCVMLAGAVLVGCASEPATPVVDDAIMSMQADGIVYGMEHYTTIDGVRTGIIRADSAYTFDESMENHLFGVDMRLYTDQGADRVRLTSETGVMHQRTEQMTARGNVILNVIDQGAVVESSELHYRPGPPESVRSDSVTTFTRGTRVDRGTCFESDLEFQNWTVCRPVTVGGGGDR